jgi:hypothetical protein
VRRGAVMGVNAYGLECRQIIVQGFTDPHFDVMYPDMLSLSLLPSLLPSLSPSLPPSLPLSLSLSLSLPLPLSPSPSLSLSLSLSPPPSVDRASWKAGRTRTLTSCILTCPWSRRSRAQSVRLSSHSQAHTHTHTHTIYIYIYSKKQICSPKWLYTVNALFFYQKFSQMCCPETGSRCSFNLSTFYFHVYFYLKFLQQGAARRVDQDVLS